MMEAPPQHGTQEYTWWSRGAHAEADARKEGRSEAGLKVRSWVDGLAQHSPHLDEVGIATRTYLIYVLAGRPLRKRLRLALWVLRGGRP